MLFLLLPFISFIYFIYKLNNIKIETNHNNDYYILSTILSNSINRKYPIILPNEWKYKYRIEEVKDFHDLEKLYEKFSLVNDFKSLKLDENSYNLFKIKYPNKDKFFYVPSPQEYYYNVLDKRLNDYVDYLSYFLKDNKTEEVLEFFYNLININEMKTDYPFEDVSKDYYFEYTNKTGKIYRYNFDCKGSYLAWLYFLKYRNPKKIRIVLENTYTKEITIKPKENKLYNHVFLLFIDEKGKICWLDTYNYDNVFYGCSYNPEEVSPKKGKIYNKLLDRNHFQEFPHIYS